DGQTLFIYRSNKYGGGDIFYSKLEGTEWTIPLMFENDINTIGIESCASQNADGNIIYFASDREGGYGGMDLYRIKKLPDGSWGRALNLGPNINTKGDEAGPFIHPNGKTLYFSSEGHKSMGGLDIFKSEQISDSLWSNPENLGYPINTVDEDMYFVLSTDGKRGYYSTQRGDGSGETDLYMIDMPGHLFNLVFIRGLIIPDRHDSSDRILASITVFNAHTNELVGIYKPNTSSGKYIVILDPSRNYILKVEAEGYATYEEELFVKDGVEFQEIIKNIELVSAEDDLVTLANMEEPEKVEDIVPEESEFSLYGQVLDAKSMTSLEGVKIVVTDKVSGEKTSLVTEASGGFEKLLSEKKLDKSHHYNVVMSKEGYFTKSLTYNIKFDKDQHINLGSILDLSMDKEVMNLLEIVEIHDIRFDVDRYEIRPDAATELDKIVEIMNKYREMVVELGSHTDCRGSESYNKALSDKRAKSSARYIMKRIINSERIYGKGYGESRLLNGCKCEGEVLSNCADEEHAVNRRTTFTVISTGSENVKVSNYR
ncbi:MAG: PD40 domain-containing protein, partial [Bacteroidetes bacterium]|nr:PD40 domain-containing protein [Bacteroidota bacterium]